MDAHLDVERVVHQAGALDDGLVARAAGGGAGGDGVAEVACVGDRLPAVERALALLREGLAVVDVEDGLAEKVVQGVAEGVVVELDEVLHARDAEGGG